MRGTARQGGQNIVQGGASGRGDDTDTPREGRHLAFGIRIEKPQGLQFGLQAQELFKQRTRPGAAHRFDNKLQFAPRLVKRQPSAQLDQGAVAWGEIQQTGGAPKHRAADQGALPLRVLQAEIAMAAGRAGKA